MNERFYDVVKCPNNELSLENCVVVSADHKLTEQNRFLLVKNGRNQQFCFTALPDGSMENSNSLGFSMIQRKWAYLAIGQKISVKFCGVSAFPPINQVTFEVDFFRTQLATNKLNFNTDDMSRDFKMKFTKYSHPLTASQQFLYAYNNIHLLFTVKTLKLDLKNFSSNCAIGISNGNTKVIFERSADSSIALTGKSKSHSARTDIINPDFDFQRLGIGGLDDEFKEIFRRAFASRVVPPELVEKMGAKHVKGILLHGPPGCGKTLMARQIGTMLSAREPQIVNGPEILNKFVGESESNIRKLFEAAEEEQKKRGANSGLHIIIFDEIDAICKQRGSVAGASGVHDTVVNQLLSKIDGVEPLNNILVIGMTNRPDLIDDALLRPGRLEVKKEIGLPDEDGRLEILNIHTEKMTASKTLACDVDLREIASMTKNFSGAELAGLVGAAQSCAFVRHTKAGSKVEVDAETIDAVQVRRSDFIAGLENDIKPAYGSKEEQFEKYMRNDILIWGSPVQDALDSGTLLINQVRNSDKTPLVSVLLTGAVGSGKTALATRIALNSSFPFLKICSPGDLVGYSESAKCQTLKKVFDDAYKSQLSCVVIDDIEKLIDYNPIGPRFSNTVAQALMVLCKNIPPPGKRLLVIATSSNLDLIREMGLDKSFDSHINVPCLSSDVDINNVLESLKNAFTPEEKEKISGEIRGKSAWVGIKSLIRMIGTAEQAEPLVRVDTFIHLLSDEAGLK